MVVGNRIIVFICVRVRLKHETEWREGPIADVYTVRARQFSFAYSPTNGRLWNGLESKSQKQTNPLPDIENEKEWVC